MKKIPLIIILLSLSLVIICVLHFVFSFEMHPKGDEIPLNTEWYSNEYSISLKTYPNQPSSPPYGKIIIDNIEYEFEFHVLYTSVMFYNEKTKDFYLNAFYYVDKNQNIVLEDITYMDDYKWSEKPEKIILERQ